MGINLVCFILNFLITSQLSTNGIHLNVNEPERWTGERETTATLSLSQTTTRLVSLADFSFSPLPPLQIPVLRLLTKVTPFLFQMCTRRLHPQDVSVWLQWRLHGGRHIRWINLLSLSKWTMWFWTRNMPVLSKLWWQVWLDCLHHRNLFLWYWSHKRSYNPI